jgi:hypothetical protein
MKKIIILLSFLTLILSCNNDNPKIESYTYKIEVHYSNGDIEIVDHVSEFSSLHQWVLDNGTLCIYEGTQNYIICDVRRWKILSKKITYEEKMDSATYNSDTKSVSN